jgi:signal transduction histidine kinase
MEAVLERHHAAEIKSLVAGPFAISYTAFFLSRFGIIFALETERVLGQSISFAISFSVIGDLIRLILLLLADKTFLSKRFIYPAPLWQVITTWFFSSFMGSLVPSVVLEILSRSSDGRLIRIIPSTLFSFTGFALATVIVAQVTTQRNLLRKGLKFEEMAINEEADSLEKLLIQQELRESLARQEVTKGLRKLSSQIESISKKNNDSEMRKLVDRLEKYGSSVIRSYSQALRSNPKSQLEFDAHTSTVDSTLRYFTQIPNLNFSPILCSVIIFSIQIPLQASRNGVSGIFFSIILLILVLPLLTFFHILIHKYVAEKFSDRILAVSSALLILYVAVDFLARHVINLIHQPLPFPPQISAFRITIAVLFISIAVSLQLRSEKLREILEESLRVKQISVAKVTSEHMRLRKELAQLLHGPAQGKLSSIGMALNLALSQDAENWAANRERWLAKARLTLQELIDEIEGPLPEVTSDINSFLNELSKQYESLVEIKFDLIDSAKFAVDADAEFSRIIQDIINNAVTNSVRHGFAHKIEILIEAESVRCVKVVVTDNGVGPRTKFKPGYGYNHVISHGGTWSLVENETGGASLSVTINGTL